MIHVAILLRPYLDAVLAGTKSVESRLTRTARAPWGRIRAGERIWFKQSSGPFRAVATAAEVEQFRDLVPADVDRLRRRFEGEVGGAASYWAAKRSSRYAVFVRLAEVRATAVGPTIGPQRGIAWLVLPNDRAPSSSPAPVGAEACVTLTAGNLRHGSVSVATIRSCFPDDAWGGPNRTAPGGRPIRLRLRGGPTIETDLVAPRGLVRCRRGWGRWFDRCGARPGDQLVFSPLGDREWAVDLHPAPGSVGPRPR